MSVEAPTAPETLGSSSLEGLSTEDLLAELERRKESEKSPSDSWPAWPETSAPFPPNLSDIENTELEEADSEEEKRPSYFREDDPEKAADERNRAIDHEILGRTVRVREDIRANAKEAVSKVDRLFAQAKNLAGKPREVLRKWHMDRANKSLEKKEARFEKKKQKWEQKLEATGSGRLHERRQAKAEKAIQKEQSKVENYKTRHVEHRQRKYQETTELREGRLERSSTRQNERAESVAESRRNAIDKKAVALGKKELRAQLRGPENNASRLETRRVMKEILGEDDVEPMLRQLGHDVINRQLSVSSMNRNKLGRASMERSVTNLRDMIVGGQEQQNFTRLKIEKAKKDYASLSSAYNGGADKESTLRELEFFVEADESVFTPEGMREVARIIQSEEDALEASIRHTRELEKQLAETNTKLAEERRKSFSTTLAATRDREKVNDNARDILN